MYKPPIEVVMGQMRTDIDNHIYQCIQEVGVDVDKEELIKALSYDRGQYEKGYADGVKEFAERLKEKSSAFGDVTACVVHTLIDNLTKELVGE